MARVTPLGVLSEFAVMFGAQSWNITAGPDGNLWYTIPAASKIMRMTTEGVQTLFAAGISAGSEPTGITAGPDGNVWFTEPKGNRVGRITPAGMVTEFSAGISAGSLPTGIAAGPDGNLWFTEPGTPPDRAYYAARRGH